MNAKQLTFDTRPAKPPEDRVGSTTHRKASYRITYCRRCGKDHPFRQVARDKWRGECGETVGHWRETHP